QLRWHDRGLYPGLGLDHAFALTSGHRLIRQVMAQCCVVSSLIYEALSPRCSKWYRFSAKTLPQTRATHFECRLDDRHFTRRLNPRFTIYLYRHFGVNFDLNLISIISTSTRCQQE